MEEREAIFELVLPRIRAIRKHAAAGSFGSAGSESLKIIAAAHKVAKVTKLCCSIIHCCHCYL